MRQAKYQPNTSKLKLKNEEDQRLNKKYQKIYSVDTFCAYRLLRSAYQNSEPSKNRFYVLRQTTNKSKSIKVEEANGKICSSYSNYP